MDIRILRPGDEALLESCAPDVFDDALDAAAVRAFLNDPRHSVAAAIDQGVMIGFASAVHYVHPDKPAPDLWINEVGVAESHQKRGIGRALMQALLDHGRALGCREAWVLTDADNAPAQRLYEAAGGTATREHVMFTFPLQP